MYSVRSFNSFGISPPFAGFMPNAGCEARASKVASAMPRLSASNCVNPCALSSQSCSASRSGNVS